VKLAQVDCFFPELRGKHINVTGRGRGSSPRVAIARAFENALRQNSGKQWHSIKATITVITEATKAEVKALDGTHPPGGTKEPY